MQFEKNCKVQDENLFWSPATVKADIYFYLENIVCKVYTQLYGYFKDWKCKAIKRYIN